MQHQQPKQTDRHRNATPDYEACARAICIFAGDALLGWFSGLYRLAVDAMRSTEFLGSNPFCELLIAGMEDYFNRINDALYSKDDVFVNATFARIERLLGRELPCSILEAIIHTTAIAVATVLAHHRRFHTGSREGYLFGAKIVAAIALAMQSKELCETLREMSKCPTSLLSKPKRDNVCRLRFTSLGQRIRVAAAAAAA